MEHIATFLEAHYLIAAVVGGLLTLLIVVGISWDDSAQQDRQPDQWFLGGTPPSWHPPSRHPSLITILARWWLKRKGEYHEK